MKNWDTPTYSNPNLHNIKQVHKELQKTYVIYYHIIFAIRWYWTTIFNEAADATPSNRLTSNHQRLRSFQVKGAWSEALACLVATKETPGIAAVAAATVVAVGKHREMRGKIFLNW